METAWELPDCDNQDADQDSPTHSRCSLEVGQAPMNEAFSPLGSANLETFVSALRGKARFAAAIGKIPQLHAIASELFLGSIDVDIDEDPEIDGKRYVVIRVISNLP